jgi:secreted trypsin-like serine protease
MHDLQNFVAYDRMSLSVLFARTRRRPDHLVLYQCPGLDLQVGTQFIQVCLAIEAVIGARAAEPPSTIPPNVVGGTPVAPGDYPWLVGLLNASVQDKAAVFCGGALIDDGAPTASSQWVLTAAHCLVINGEVVSPSAIEVLAGQPDLTQVQPEQRHPVEEIIVHPLYLSGYALVNDIALLRLAASVNVGNTLPVATPADTAYLDC